MKGITVKKIITKAWLVIIELNTWSLLINGPQIPNFNRMIIFIDEPDIPAQKEKIQYNIPISLWLVE
jgi:hypothetical protein